MTTNIPSYPRHIRAVQVGVHASRRPRIQCCHYVSRVVRKVDLWILGGFGGGLLKQYYLLKAVGACIY